MSEELTAGEAARFLGVNRQRINELARAGRIGRQVAGRYWVFTLAELEAFKNEPKRRGGRPKNESAMMEPDPTALTLSKDALYVMDANGNRVAVVVPIAVYERIMEKLEDYEDAAFAVDYVKRKAAGQLTPDETEVVPWEQVKADYEARYGALTET